MPTSALGTDYAWLLRALCARVRRWGWEPGSRTCRVLERWIRRRAGELVEGGSLQPDETGAVRLDSADLDLLDRVPGFPAAVLGSLPYQWRLQDPARFEAMCKRLRGALEGRNRADVPRRLAKSVSKGVARYLGLLPGGGAPRRRARWLRGSSRSRRIPQTASGPVSVEAMFMSDIAGFLLQGDSRRGKKLPKTAPAKLRDPVSTARLERESTTREQDPGELASAAEASRLLRSAMAQISEEQRIVVELRLQELPWDQIARELGRSEESARALHDGAMQELGRVLRAPRRGLGMEGGLR